MLSFMLSFVPAFVRHVSASPHPRPFRLGLICRMATALCSQFGVFKSTWSQTDGVTFQVQLTRRMRASGWVADGDVPAEGDKPSSLWKSAQNGSRPIGGCAAWDLS